MHIRSLLTTLALPLAVLCACADDPVEPGADAAGPTRPGWADHDGDDRGAVRKATRWTKHNLSVCFIPRATPFPGHDLAESQQIQTQARAWIQDAVKKTWGAQTRFVFDWRGTCTGAGSADITIAGTGGVNTLGFSAYGSVSATRYPSMEINMPCELPQDSCVSPNPSVPGGGNMPNNCTVVQGQSPPASLETCVRITAIHEFGHALGLLHEHARTDRPSTCTALVTAADQHEAMWSYDAASKMNYCATDLYSRQTLSAGDLRTASTLYAPQVLAFTSPSYQATRKSFGPGIYTSGLAIASLIVPPGLTATVCGSGTCQTYTDSAPTLGVNVTRLEVRASVLPFEHTGFRGRTASWGPGIHMGSAINAVCNDCISSLLVPHGLDARVCWHEAGGAGDVCTLLSGGPDFEHNLYDTLPAGFDNQTSYVQVIPKAVLYREPSFVGIGKSFAIGLKLGNPLAGASSLLVLPGYNAKLCTSAGSGSGAGTCQTFTSSTDQLPAALNDNVGYLETWASPVSVVPPPR